jgi:hypothetical protein
MFSDELRKKNQNTHFMFNNFSKNRVLYEIMRKKFGRARQATDDNIIRRRKDAVCLADN